MSKTFVSQINDATLYAERAKETTKGVDIDTALEGIQAVIPEAASSSNQLADKAYVDSATGAIGAFKVVSLTTDANPHPDVGDPSTKVIYLTKDSQSTATDPYTEWIYLAPVAPETVGTWEIIGETTVDLSGYKTVQTAVDESGSTLKTLTRIQQNTNGDITPTFSDIASASTSGKGVVQLYDDVDSTDTTKAATANAVKTAKDTADGKIAKVANATAGNVPTLNASGEIVDSGTALTNLKTKQTAVVDPTASGNTLSFIDSISQNANGEISATKKSVKVASTYTGTGEGSTDPVNGQAVKAAIDGLDAEVTSSDGTNVQVKVTEQDGKVTAVNITTDTTASSTHVHGNITNDGKIGSTANLAVVTGDSGAVTAADIHVDAPSATGTNTSGIAYIDSVSQSSKGQISATKTYVPVAASSTYGVVTVTTVEL